MHPVPGFRSPTSPAIDAVLISHDHYDHLDQPSIGALEQTHRPHYVVPLGVNAHLLAWGVPEQRITALDWRDETRGRRHPAHLHRGPAQLRARARRQPDPLGRLGAARSPRTRRYFAGDSGTSKRFAAIGADLGPFDLTLMPIGAYDPFWPDIHMDPEQALAAHRDVNRIGDEMRRPRPRTRPVSPTSSSRATSASTPPGARTRRASAPTTTRTVQTAARESLLVPVHWATFNLSMHWWAEPVRRLRRARPQARVPVAFPRVGERVDLSSGDAAQVAAAHSEPWWEQCAAPEDRD